MVKQVEEYPSGVQPMATDLGQSRATPTAKYEVIVTEQLGRAERRIRTLDLTAALLGFLAGSCAYAVLMVVCDRWLDLFAPARILAWLIYLVAAAVYLGYTVVRPLRRQVNPYYAARRVEETLPGSKNSLVNWLDLRDEKVLPAIRGAVGQRAARDLGRADIDQAISGRRAKWAGTVAAVLAGCFLVCLFLVGPGPFFYRLARAFAPFAVSGQPPTRTQLTMINPPEGDATVAVGRPVTLTVNVEGKVPDPKKPDALKLHLRYDESEPYQERPLQPDSGREWSATVSAYDVQNGFLYKITGGDAATPEYRVSVRSTPLISDFLATYQFRAYTGRVEEVRRLRKIAALRGTTVVLRVRTNRTVQEAALDFDGKDGRQTLRGERLAGEPQTFQVVFPLDQSGSYRLRFTSTDGETYTDSLAHPVVAFPDEAPKVELTVPGKDLRLPANGVLQLEGMATDDVGVKSITLRMQVKDGLRLQAKPYRSDDKIRLPAGGYPLKLAYKDFVELPQVKTETGEPFQLKPGMELEYWLEASDACDFPAPHVTESKRYLVQVIEPTKDEKQRQQERQQAQNEQKKHEEKQDQQLKDENQAREQANEQQKDRNEDEKQKSQEQKDSGDGKSDEKKGEGSQDKSEPSKDGSGQESKSNDKDGKGGQESAEEKKQNEQRREQTKRLQDAIDKQEKKNREKGEEKGDPKPSDGKGKGEGNRESPTKAGESKPDQREQPAKDQAEPKQGPKQAEKQETGEGKGQGGGEAKENKGEGKGGNPKEQAAEAKHGESPDPSQPSESKDGGAGEGQKKAGEEKAEGNNASKESAKADGKGAGAKGTPEASTAGEAKGENAPEPKGEGKGVQPEKIASAKDAATPKDAKGDNTERAREKPSLVKDEKDGARAEAKGDPKAEAEQKIKEATKKEVAELAKALENKEFDKKDLEKKGEQKDVTPLQQLRDIKDHARDEQVRKEAEKELEKALQNMREKAAVDKPKHSSKQPPPPEEDTPATAKGDGKNEPDKGKGKPVDSKENVAEAKGSGNRGTPESDVKDGEKMRANVFNGRPGSEFQPLSPPESKPEKPLDPRASVLQLESLRDQVKKDPSLLQEAGITAEQFQKFIRDGLEYNKRIGAMKKPDDNDKVPAPQVGGSLTTTGGQRTPGGTGSAGDIRNNGAGKPPADYRDAVKEFTRQTKTPESKDK
jgi:hypothetical protein